MKNQLTGNNGEQVKQKCQMMENIVDIIKFITKYCRCDKEEAGYSQKTLLLIMAMS